MNEEPKKRTRRPSKKARQALEAAYQSGWDDASEMGDGAAIFGLMIGAISGAAVALLVVWLF